jgi:FdhD protein
MNEHIAATKTVTVIRRSKGSIVARETAKQIISEATLRVILNGEEYVSLICLQEYPEQLALGFLFTEGVIDSLEDVENVSLDEQRYEVSVRLRSELDLSFRERQRSVTSTSAKGLTFLNPKKQETLLVLEDSFRVSMRDIWQMADSFSRMSQIKKEIGGVHSAMFRYRDSSVFCEDVGRHNCIDKIAGILLKDGQLERVTEGLMFSSGRVSTEILSKILRLRIPIYVSLTTPTSSVVDTARKYNLTLLGYVRDGSAVLYSGSERVEL